MRGLGNGDNGEWTFLDIVTLISFIIGLENLDMNISQTDLQEETNRLDKKVDEKVRLALSEIHEHLEMQDKKFDEILEVINNDGRRDLF